MRGLTLSLFAAAAMFGTATLVSAQPQQAGVSAAVRGQVALARASANIVGRQVQSGDPIFLGDAITSGKASGMQVMLMDETVFSIGPNSEISIDEFVYDPATDSGKVTASVAKGVFRFITGKIAQKRPEDMTVRLLTATIGIRGTIVAGAVRSTEGSDASVDQVFAGLKGTVPDAENAKDFVVLLGPGDENNTNASWRRLRILAERAGESGKRSQRRCPAARGRGRFRRQRRDDLPHRQRRGRLWRRPDQPALRFTARGYPGLHEHTQRATAGRGQRVSVRFQRARGQHGERC